RADGVVYCPQVDYAPEITRELPGRRHRRDREHIGRGRSTHVSDAYAGIEDHVGEVTEDVRGDGHQDGHERAGLDQRDVLEERGLEHHAAEARIGEHRLDHDHAGHQVVDLQHDHGYWIY